MSAQDRDTVNATVPEVTRNIGNGNRKLAAQQINDHDEPARMAIAVLCDLCSYSGAYGDASADTFRDAVMTVIRTLNAGDQ